MKFSKAWLQTYSKEALPDSKKLEEVITCNAFEIEETTLIARSQGSFADADLVDTTDIVFDIKVLPNRAHDALGHRGMARDMCALTGTTFVDPHTYYHGDGDASIPSPRIVIDDTKACTRCMSVRIDGVSVTPSPVWLRERLEAIGHKSINSIVDITNFVQFSINKPMHAYDAELVTDNTLHVRYAYLGETLTTLDDKELTVDEATLMIADSTKSLSLAGIKGGKFSGVSSTTTSVILESANFNATQIRTTSQKYGIRTDASKRFENEISDTLVEEGLRLTIALICDMNPGAKVSCIVDTYPSPREITPVTVSVTQINTVLGTSLSYDDIASVFSSLAFTTTTQGEVFTVIAPADRLDICIKEDLIEEVARMRGLSTVPSILPKLSRKGVLHKRMYYENKIKSILCEQGFSEVITYSFGNVGEVELVKGQARDKEKLRSTLGTGLLAAFQMNMLNAPLINVSTIKMYEFGNVFMSESGPGCESTRLERRHVAITLDDGKKKSVFTEEIELLLNVIKRTLGIPSLTYKTISTKPYMLEMDFDTLIESLPEPTSYEPLTQNPLSSMYQTISPYPFITRDIAMWVPDSVTWESISDLCSQVGSPLVMRIDLFDTFSKEIEGVKKTSYACRVVFQSFEKTLTDDEVNSMIEPYYEVLKSKGYEIR